MGYSFNKKKWWYTPIPNFLPVYHDESVIKDSISDSWRMNIEFSMEARCYRQEEVYITFFR